MTGGLKIGDKTTLKIVETVLDKLVNSSGGSLSGGMTATNINSSLGKNEARYITTNVHVGKPTTQRVKRLINTPYIEYNEKTLGSSDKDYIKHILRKYLDLKSGFNQKGFCFIMEDTYMTVHDLIQFMGSSNKVEKALHKTKNGKIDLYGAIYKDQKQIKIVNQMEYYNVSVKLSLVKINDINNDIRELVSECINSKSNLSNLISPKRKETAEEANKSLLRDSKNQKKEKEDDEINSDSKESKTFFEEIIDNTKDKAKTKLEENIDKLLNTSLRGHPYGKINEDDQYSDPNTTNKINRITLNFNTSLKCQLTDSTKFNDRAKIIESYVRVLTPGSIWEFNLHQHFGKGIHLNYLYDIESENKDHPVGYVLLLEYIGDRRGKIRRNIDNDFFFGYAPCKIHIEFCHKLAYLADTSNGDDEAPAIYRKKKKEEDFEDGSVYEALFTPNREASFNVDFENFKLYQETKKLKPKAEYTLEYDTNILSTASNPILENVKFKFSNEGIETENLTEDDLKFKTNSSSEDNDQTQSPTEEVLDLDKD